MSRLLVPVRVLQSLRRHSILFGVLVLAAGPALATDPFPGEIIMRVEEDWVIDVGLADGVNTAPEIVTVFGPSNPNYGTHAVFEMNHATYPDFDRGGMQIQAWHANWLLGSKRHTDVSELLTVVERIKYTCTTRLKADDDWVRLEVKNGESVTYGNFGGDGSLKLYVWTEKDSLNDYDAESSLIHSRVTFGANRVNQFFRDEIRYYTADGDVITDSEDKYIHKLVEADVGPDPVNE
jgi:hypothetical protein